MRESNLTNLLGPSSSLLSTHSIKKPGLLPPDQEGKTGRSFQLSFLWELTPDASLEKVPTHDLLPEFLGRGQVVFDILDFSRTVGRMGHRF